MGFGESDRDRNPPFRSKQLGHDLCSHSFLFDVYELQSFLWCGKCRSNRFKHFLHDMSCWFSASGCINHRLTTIYSNPLNPINTWAVVFNAIKKHFYWLSLICPSLSHDGYPTNLSLPSSPLCFSPSHPPFHSRSLPLSVLLCLFPPPPLPIGFSSPLSSPSTPQSVIVKSVERNAVNMYEARKFLLGLESNGVSSSLPTVTLNPAPSGPSTSLICPVGLDILASAGLGLSNLGNDALLSLG